MLDRIRQHPLGFLALIVATAALWFSVAGYIANPVREAERGIASLIEPGICPSGWQDASERDIHGRVKACFSGDPKAPKPGEWLVVFGPDGRFEHAIQIDVPGQPPVTDTTKVPGWPR